jgi:periplasmic protein TonB
MSQAIGQGFWATHKLRFLADVSLHGQEDFTFILTQEPVISWRRPIAVALATLLAALLHGYVLFAYANKPAPMSFSAAAPLPMIAMELSAPPAPAVNPVQQSAIPEKPKAVLKPQVKPPVVKPKPKPKLPPAETAVKQFDEQKAEPETALTSAVALPTQQHDALTTPRNDAYVPADSNAAYLNNPKPEYPPQALRQHWQGSVLLRVYVGEDGHTLQVLLQHSSGHELLDESALDAVKNWRFVPAKRGDAAEASWVSVPIVFKLE